MENEKYNLDKEYNIIKEGKSRKVTLKKQHPLKEARSFYFEVVFITSNGNTTKRVDDKTNFRRLYQEVQSELGTDDFWVDDAWVNGLSISGIDWVNIIAPNGMLDENFIDEVYNEPEYFTVKVQFCQNHGYDIDEERLDSIEVYDAKGENWVEGNWKVWFPEDWLADQFEMMYNTDIITNNWTYFVNGVAQLFSDDEPNGSAKYDRIGNFFVYTYEI